MSSEDTFGHHKSESFVLQDIKTYSKTVVINTEDRQIDHWLRIESPETDPYLSGYIIYDKGCTIKQWDWKKCFLKSIVQGHLYIPKSTAEKWGERRNLTLSPTNHKIGLRQIMDLNVKGKTVKLLKNNIDNIFMTLNME